MYRCLDECGSDRYAIHRQTIVSSQAARHGQSERAGGHALGKERRGGSVRARTAHRKARVFQAAHDRIGNRTRTCAFMWTANERGIAAFEEFKSELKTAIAIGRDDGAKLGGEKPRVASISIQGGPDAIRESVRQ